MPAFNPTSVFRTLYKPACVEACRRVGAFLNQTHDEVVHTLEAHMRRLFARYMTLGSSATLHREEMASLQKKVAHAESRESCAYCIRRNKQHKLPCGHGVCETCVRIFYCECRGERYIYEADMCLLCGKSTSGMRVGLKPETASVRVLSIDGGGSRARVPLEFLRVLQNRVGLPCPVQRYFDVAFGTSSGIYDVSSFVKVLSVTSFRGHGYLRSLYQWVVD